MKKSFFAKDIYELAERGSGSRKKIRAAQALVEQYKKSADDMSKIHTEDIEDSFTFGALEAAKNLKGTNIHQGHYVVKDTTRKDIDSVQLFTDIKTASKYMSDKIGEANDPKIFLRNLQADIDEGKKYTQNKFTDVPGTDARFKFATKMTKDELENIFDKDVYKKYVEGASKRGIFKKDVFAPNIKKAIESAKDKDFEMPFIGRRGGFTSIIDTPDQPFKHIIVDPEKYFEPRVLELGSFSPEVIKSAEKSKKPKKIGLKKEIVVRSAKKAKSKKKNLH